MADPSVKWRDLLVGSTRLRLAGPAQPPGDPPERILLWWGVTTSALALAERLLEGPSLGGRRVLELGCGLGLAGLAAGLAGAEVWFTDLEEAALAHARRNAQAVGLPEERCRFLSLPWESPGDVGAVDLVLGSEILYDYGTHSELLRLVPRLVAPGGRLWLADRPRLVVERFLGRLRKVGFAGGRTDRRLALPGEGPQSVAIWDWARVAETPPPVG